MSITRHHSARVCATAALLIAGVGAVATPASASERWRFDRERGGGVAESCGIFGGERVCAAVYCGRGVRGYEIGLTGYEPRGRRREREGSVLVDGRGVKAVYEHDRQGPVGEVWRADVGRDTNRVIDRIKAGARLSMDLADNGPAFDFTLNGSSAAISKLERRCDRRADASGSRRDRDGVQVSDNAIRFGNDDFGFEIRFGDDDRRYGDRRGFGRDWTRLGSETVSRERERDTINLSRRDGRFHSIRLRALNNDVRVRRVQVRYGNGAEQNVRVGRTLREGQSLDVMQLRGRRGRFIDRITLVYDTQGRGPNGEIEVWGRTAPGGDHARGPRFGPNWEQVASNDVDRRRDRDVIRLNRGDGRFDALRLRVLDNDVRVRKVRVRYGNGAEHEVDVDRRIREGQASDVIELRGRKGRFIDRIVLVYDTQTRGPKAEVEVWGRKTSG